ncbi:MULTISPECIES: feruloyl-CoA synthase [Roseobacteraceae]|uniref:Short-chain-fatty-acid--CoA ligase n=1 Tax=Pseudosulfitobacter pseudonitzschiae TaxID=1402135 RepID=A0A221K3G1_9RHOB|nr:MULTISPECIES: feruloyl-CoA synthase [Roseobacteraceae]ASM73544.1 short-chain-fatty-acid--CoA ligase [Pseudosulfitobacter pseudonitzschiae]
MTHTPILAPHSVTRENRADGTIVLTADTPLGEVARNSGVWLDHWARATPDTVFLAERSGADWRRETYASARQKARAIAGWFLGQGMGADTPVLILSGNSIDHALLTLGAHYVGVPTVPVAEQYTLIPAAHGRLDYVVNLIKPARVFAVDGAAYAAGLARAKCPAIASSPGETGATPFADLLAHSDAGVDAAFAKVGPDTVAKILLTSGSTSDPKGVLTTQRMMTTNQTQLAQGLPFLRQRPPVIVDWLPWNHVFGGSHNFNMVLSGGGSLYIDDGKPLPALFGRTLENLAMVPGTVSFNVPVGFAQLLTALRSDDALRESYFRDLDMIFYAGASLPQETWVGLEELAARTGRRVPLITSSWGLTETAPAALLQQVPTEGAGTVGVPLPGVTVKLVPDADMRCDVRVSGPSIMQSYLNNPAKTAEAFDDEGFFITGDAMRFVDAGDPNLGLRFDGRISEDFKLMTGTWVQAANLRLVMLGLLAPYVADIVVTGQGRDQIGLLIVPNRAAIEKAQIDMETDGGACISPALANILRARLRDKATEATGSATRVTRALILSEPPDMGEGEVTAKGNINFAKLLSRRAVLVDRLYDDADPAAITI